LVVGFRKTVLYPVFAVVTFSGGMNEHQAHACNPYSACSVN